MIVEAILVAVLPALLISAAVWDLTSFTIPNMFPAAMLALFAVFALVSPFASSGMTLEDLAWHLAAGGIGLAAGMMLFALGWIGGGDAKLFAMIALWLGWNSLFEYAVYASLMGGALTLVIIMFRKFPLPSGLLGQGWLLRLSDARSGIPYGVALSAAALVMLPTSELFHLAASAS